MVSEGRRYETKADAYRYRRAALLGGGSKQETTRRGRQQTNATAREAGCQRSLRSGVDMSHFRLRTAGAVALSAIRPRPQTAFKSKVTLTVRLHHTRRCHSSVRCLYGLQGAGCILPAHPIPIDTLLVFGSPASGQQNVVGDGFLTSSNVVANVHPATESYFAAVCKQ